MRKMKKWFALLLMVMLSLPSALAIGEAPALPFERALAEGKSADFIAEISWNSPSFFDAQKNELFEAILGAMTVTGSFGPLEDGAYFADMDINIEGDAVLPMDMVITEEGLFANSPLYGGAIAISVEEIPALYENIGRMLDQLAAAEGEVSGMSFEQIYGQIGQQMYEQLKEGEAAPAAAPDAMLDVLNEEFGMEEVIQAINAWSAEALEGESFEGEISSVFGVEASNATVYALSKEEMAAFLDAVLPPLLDNTALWEAILAQQNFASSGVTDPEELLAQIRMMAGPVLEAVKTAIPEETTLQYNECFDDEGNAVVRQVEMSIPNYDEMGGELFVYIEWIPDSPTLFLIAGEESNNIQFMMEKAEPETVTADGVEQVFDAFMAEFTLIENAEATFQGGLQIEKGTSTDENRLELRAVLGARGALGSSGLDGAEIALQLVSEGGDAPSEFLALDVWASANGEMESLLTAQITETVGDAVPRFDHTAEGIEFIRPGQMDAEAFEAWAKTTVLAGAEQAKLRLMAAMPPEVLALMMQQ